MAGFVLKSGVNYPALPKVDADETYPLADIQKARSGVQIQTLQAGQALDNITQSLLIDDIETGDKKVSDARLARSTKWFSLLDAEVKDGKVVFKLASVQGKKTASGRVVRVLLSYNTERSGGPIGTEWYYQIA